MSKSLQPVGAWRLFAGAAALLALASSAALAQGGAATTTRGNTGTTNTAPSAMPMPQGIVPNRSELPGSAFSKLDRDSKGYVTRDDLLQLQGFDSAFLQADQNRDGRLNASEFNSAWSIYTGQNP